MGQEWRQWTQDFVALRSVTGATPPYFLQGGGVTETLATLTEGRKQAWRERRASTGQCSEELVVRQRGRELRNSCVELSIPAETARSWEQCRNQQAHGLGHSEVGVQRTLGADGLDAPLDGRGVAHVACAEEVGERL